MHIELVHGVGANPSMVRPARSPVSGPGSGLTFQPEESPEDVVLGFYIKYRYNVALFNPKYSLFINFTCGNGPSFGGPGVCILRSGFVRPSPVNV